MVQLEAKFLFFCETVKPENKVSASKTQRWDRHGIEISNPKGRKEEKRGEGRGVSELS